MRPASILTYDIEAEHLGHDVAEELDLVYVDELAHDIAGLLGEGVTAECVYQPGDGTRYPLVIVPLSALRSGRPRVSGGSIWERHAVSGMKGAGGKDCDDGVGYYGPDGYLVCYLEHGCYPFVLSRREQDLAGGYVGAKFDVGTLSGIALAILLRAIGHHLDQRGIA